jgi:CO/xanthine dehydrogenase Mo-binding subunit
MAVLSKIVKKYYTDITLPEILYGVIIRSPIDSGTIRSITHPNLPENYTIITARDIV